MNGGGNAGLQPASTTYNGNDYSTMIRSRSPLLHSQVILDSVAEAFVGGERWVKICQCAEDIAKSNMPNKQMVKTDWARCVLVYRVRCDVFES